MHCKWESCDQVYEPANYEFGEAILEARTRVNPPDFIDVSNEGQYANKLRDALRQMGYCAQSHDDDPGKISGDEVSVAQQGRYYKEHWDVVLSSGDTRFPFGVAKGYPKQ